MRHKIEGGVGALRESDDTNFVKPNGQSRDLNIYGISAYSYLQLQLYFYVYNKLINICVWFILTEIDKCKEAGCDHCKIEDGSPQCFCNDGFLLDVDGKTCKGNTLLHFLWLILV